MRKRSIRSKATKGFLAYAVWKAKQCVQRREGDEYTCTCGIRWDIHDDKPQCLRKGF